MVVLAISAIILIVIFGTIACAVAISCCICDCLRCALCGRFQPERPTTGTVLGKPAPPGTTTTTTTTTTVGPDGMKTTTVKTVATSNVSYAV